MCDRPDSRAEISRRAGISKPTVSLALRSLLESGSSMRAPKPPDGPSYGAVYFEPVLGGRARRSASTSARVPVRGAICDLSGTIRARQDVELAQAEAGARSRRYAAARLSHRRRRACRELSMASSSAFPESSSRNGMLQLAAMCQASRGRHFGPSWSARWTANRARERHQPGRARRALAGRSERGRRLRRSSRSVRAWAPGLVLRGELHSGRHGAAGEIDFALDPPDEDDDPCAAAVSALASRLASSGRQTEPAPPYDTRSIFGAARNDDPVGREVVGEVARRIALHVAPIAAVADVELIVLGGGIAANGDLLLDPVGRVLAEWLPFPPRVEVSTLGEAAILTGALAVGLQAARENVFTRARGTYGRSASRIRVSRLSSRNAAHEQPS